MKILYLPSHLSTGGMPQFVLKRIQSLKEYTDNEYYVVEYQCHSLDFVVQRNAIKGLLGENFTTLYEDKMELFKVIEEWQPDIIHIDEPSERLDREMIKKLYNSSRKYRIVETCHDIVFDPNNEKLFHPDLYSFCTPYHEQTFADMDSKFVTILYPIEKKELHRVEGRKQVLNVGLWTRGKNQGEGIEIARKYPDMDFNFIGNQAGNFKDYWEPLMKDLPPNVKVWGERNDIDAWMEKADIFMFNSTWECNPLVLREAIGYGLPIVGRNLPQYGGMYDGFINPIDSDLNNVQCNYKVPTDCTPFIFALRHEEAYKKILEYPAQKQKIKINQHFVDQPFLEIKGMSDSNFLVKFYDEQGKCHYDATLKSNSWVQLDRQYYTKWTAKVYQDGSLIYKYTLNLTNKTVFIVIDSKSLGDTLAWVPYALEFQKKHNCKVVVSTFWNHILDYPELEMVKPSAVVNCYALYRIGWFYNSNKEPVLCNTIPLQQAASNILGLEFEEIKPMLKYDIGNNKYGKYVTIATNSTSGLKFWLKDSWQQVIDFLIQSGYKVINTSKERNPFNNCIQLEDTGIENTMSVIHHSEFFIGLSSGISHLAWGLGKKVVMIAGFTDIDHEFECVRPYNVNACHGCWNDPNIRFDAGDWNFCPYHKNTDKMFECQNQITPEMVIAEINKIT